MLASVSQVLSNVIEDLLGVVVVRGIGALALLSIARVLIITLLLSSISQLYLLFKTLAIMRVLDGGRPPCVLLTVTTYFQGLRRCSTLMYGGVGHRSTQLRDIL